MTRKISYFIVILPLLLVQCASFYGIFRVDSTFYNDTELQILAKTTEAIRYDYGYDPDIDIEYVFTYSANDLDIKKMEQNLEKTLSTLDTPALVKYYEKLYTLKVKTLYTLELLRDKKIWNNFTYIEKHYLVDLNTYVDLIEKQVSRRDALYAGTIIQRKNLIKDQVEDELISKDIHDFSEERFYYLEY